MKLGRVKFSGPLYREFKKGNCLFILEGVHILDVEHNVLEDQVEVLAYSDYFYEINESELAPEYYAWINLGEVVWHRR